MIFTNISWLGDFFMLWPVASWYNKTHNKKIHFVVTKNYYMYEKIKPFLELQNFCEKVTLLDIGTDAWDKNQWIFNPNDYGIKGEYCNFGFKSHIDEYMSQYYSKFYNFDWDREMKLILPDYLNIEIPDKVTIKIAHQENGYWNNWRSMMPKDVTELSVEDPFMENVYKGYKSNERYLGSSSFAILMDMLGLKSTIYAGKGFPEHVFFKNKHTIHYV
jgi:hypothetical protein